MERLFIAKPVELQHLTGKIEVLRNSPHLETAPKRSRACYTTGSRRCSSSSACSRVFDLTASRRTASGSSRTRPARLGRPSPFLLARQFWRSSERVAVSPNGIFGSARNASAACRFSPAAMSARFRCSACSLLRWGLLSLLLTLGRRIPLPGARASGLGGPASPTRRQDRNPQGRMAVPAQDFVAPHSVKSVIGAGAGYKHHPTLLTLFMFCAEPTDPALGGPMQGLVEAFRTVTEPLVQAGAIFAQLSNQRRTTLEHNLHRNSNCR